MTFPAHASTGCSDGHIASQQQGAIFSRGNRQRPTRLLVPRTFPANGTRVIPPLLGVGVVINCWFFECPQRHNATRRFTLPSCSATPSMVTSPRTYKGPPGTTVTVFSDSASSFNSPDLFLQAMAPEGQRLLMRSNSSTETASGSPNGLRLSSNNSLSDRQHSSVWIHKLPSQTTSTSFHSNRSTFFELIICR